MRDIGDIQSLTEFTRNAKNCIQHVKESQKPLILTVNGKAEVVVQDAIAYQKLLDRLEYAESVAAIRQGIEECDRGEAKLAKEALEELRAKHGRSG